MSAKTLILGTAGHIDHGKTALVRALTGIDTDRLPQEKRRGMTIDIGFAELQLDDCQLGIIDVPGHERFVKNMLAGATAIDMGLLVVAADDGVMPQTREHMAILDLLGVEQGVIAITKSDLRDDEWLQLVDEDVRQLVAGTGLEGAEIVRTAVPPDGPPLGLELLRQALAKAARRVPERPPSGQFRMSVDRSFSVVGRGTVVTGTVSEGCVAIGDSLERLPDGDLLKVRGLENHGRQVDSVCQGQRAAINFAGVHYQEIERGQVLATPGYLRPARWLTVALQVMQASPGPIKHRSRYSLHIGAQLVSADLYLYGSNQLAAGELAVAQLHCQLPVTTVWGAPFILRQESPQVTLGGGRVLQPTARPIRRRRTDLVAKLTALKSNVPAERVAAAIYFFRVQPWTKLDLSRSSGVEADQAEPIVEQLVADGEIVSLTLAAPTTVYIHAEVVAEAERTIQFAIDDYHQAHPLSLAMPRSQLHARLAERLDRSMCDALIDRLCAADQLQSDKDSVARAGFHPELGSKYEQALASIDAAFESARFEPPTLEELAETAHLSVKDVRKLIELRVEQGLMVAVGSDLFLSRKWEKEMRQLVTEAFESQEGLTVGQIRDALRTSRKFAVPLCEYLDRIGLTRRTGDLRIPGSWPR